MCGGGRAGADQRPDDLSLATLFTVPLAAVIAVIALGQTTPEAAVPALALLLAGTALVISARSGAPAEAT